MPLQVRFQPQHRRSSNMRADRLLSILLLLQTRGRMTARELAEHMEVSERTIYRDIEALGMAGIPVYAERGPGGGCTLLDGYQTRLTGLTEAEIRALFLLNMTHPLADLGLDKALDDALLKLSAALPAPQPQQPHASPGPRIPTSNRRFRLPSHSRASKKNSVSLLFPGKQKKKKNF